MSDLAAPGGAGAAGGRFQADARGVQIGRENVQINYFVSHGRLTSTDGVDRPPLVDSSGVVESPFRGLGAFGERDAPFFHGREAVTDEVLGRLSDAAQWSGLLVVSGVSGAGKSSLLRAGVLPRIRGQGLASVPGAARWTGLVFTPTRDPIDQLALQTAGLLGTDAVRVRANLAADPASFALTARQLALRAAAPDADGRVLLIVDQFEQVFTQCTDDGLRRKFVTALGSAAGTGAALVVIVVRADFDARCADFPQLTAGVKDRYLVTAMDELQLRTAIERPVATLAASCGQPLSIQPSLVDYLVREMLESPAGAGLPTSGAGALPLLSHALDQAWRHRMGPMLTLADYERGGRIQGAIEASAQRAFKSLTPAQRSVARRVFLRLTTASDDGAPVRDRVPHEELLGAAGADRRDDVAGVLTAFTAERLVTQASASVEISHDALLTAWPLLRDQWLAESRADLAVRSRLRNAARAWARHGRKPGYLYRDEVLDETDGAVRRMKAAPGRQPELSREEAEFLRASARARRNAVRGRTLVRGGFVTLTVGLMAAVAIALTSLASANRDLKTADLQQMSAESAALHDTDPAVSALAAADAWRSAPSAETRDLGIEAATNPLIGEFDAAPGPMAVSPDGAILAVGDSSESPVAGAPAGTNVTLWSMTERKVLGYITFPGTTGVYSVAFSPISAGHAASTLAIGTTRGVALYLVSGSSFRQLQTLPAGLLAGVPSQTALDPVAFRSDGMLAAGSTAYGGDIRLFADVNGRYSSSPRYVVRNTQNLESLSFGPGGSLAVGTESNGRTAGRVSVYAAADGYSSAPVTTTNGRDNGQSVATFNAAGLLAVDYSAATVVDRYSGDALSSVALSPSVPSSGPDAAMPPAAISNRNLLAVAEGDGLHVYVAGQPPAADGFIEIRVLPNPAKQPAEELGFTPDGNALIENIGGEVYIYDTRVLAGTLHSITPAVNGPGVQVMAFDPADTAILAVATPSAVDLIDVRDGGDGSVRVLPGTVGATWAAFAPSGKLAVVVDGTVRIFPDPLTAPRRSSLARGPADASRVTFSPDGAMAVIGDLQPTLTVYPPGSTSAGTVVPLAASGVSSADLSVENAVFGPGGQLAAILITGPTQSPVGVEVFAPGTYAEEGFIADTSIAQQLDDAAIAFAPDGTLAIGDTAGIELYAAGSYRKPRIIAGVLPGDDSGYGWVAFSRGGILLSENSLTGLSLWDYKTGQNLATFNVAAADSFGESSDESSSIGQQLAISPDGRYFASESDIGYSALGSGEAEVTIIWSAPYLDGDVADGVRSLCGELGGAPDPSQWRQYFLSGLAYPGVCA